jgi:tellurite resistance protein TehA-like permease
VKQINSRRIFIALAMPLGIMSFVIILFKDNIYIHDNSSIATILTSLMFFIFFIAGVINKEVWLRGMIVSKSEHPIVYYVFNLLWIALSVYFMTELLNQHN